MNIKVTAAPDVSILGCVRCDTAVLPEGEWPRGGTAAVRCPLCGWRNEVTVVEVGAGDAFHFNPVEQRADAANTPLYRVESVDIEEDLVLIAAGDLLEDPAFFALQGGVAPISSFGWVGGEGLLGSEGYRLVLVVRVADVEEDLFRLEFPTELIPRLAQVTDDRTVVLVSGQKGVLFAEAGEVYLQAMAEAGRQPGDQATLNEWVSLQG